MKRFTVKDSQMYLNGCFLPIAARTIRLALRMNAQRTGQPMPGPEEREISLELAEAILHAEREMAIDALGRELLARAGNGRCA